MLEADLPPVGHRSHRLQEQTAAERSRLDQERSGVELQAVRAFTRQRLQPGRGLRVEPLAVLPGQLGRPGQLGAGRPAVGGVQLGQDAMTDPVARIAQIGVGLVLDPRWPRSRSQRRTSSRDTSSSGRITSPRRG